jgi:hypothetical protein
MYRGVNGLLVSYSKRDYSGVWEMEGKFGLEGQVATQNTSLQAIIPRGGLCEEAKVTKLIDWDT